MAKKIKSLNPDNPAEFEQRLMAQGVDYCRLLEITAATREFESTSISFRPQVGITTEMVADVVESLARYKVGSLATTVDHVHEKLQADWRIMNSKCGIPNFRRNYTPPQI